MTDELKAILDSIPEGAGAHALAVFGDRFADAIGLGVNAYVAEVAGDLGVEASTASLSRG